MLSNAKQMLQAWLFESIINVNYYQDIYKCKQMLTNVNYHSNQIIKFDVRFPNKPSLSL